MRYWIYWWELLGGHVHATAFVSPNPDQTYANCGTLVMSEEDWHGFASNLKGLSNVAIRKKSKANEVIE